MIKLENIVKEYKTQGGSVPVLKDITLHINKGEMLAIMGRSGSGKSTLLNIIGGITEPTSGDVWIKGNKIDFNDKKELCALRRKHIGYVVQNFALVSRKTVWENVLLPIQSSRNKKERDIKAKNLLAELGVIDKLNMYPYQISNGEKQRVAIARALIDDKKIILADEPTGALDYQSAENTIRLLQNLTREKEITVLIVTHDQEIANKCDRITHIMYGKIEDDKH